MGKDREKGDKVLCGREPAMFLVTSLMNTKQSLPVSVQESVQQELDCKPVLALLLVSQLMVVFSV